MNKKKLTVLMAVFALLLLLLPACTKIEEAANISEIDDSNESSADLLVGTLEYLLNENEITDEESSFIQTKDDEQEHNEKEESSNQIETTIYYGNGASDKLDTEISTMEELTADNLLNALAGHNIVSIGTKVNSCEEVEENGIKFLYLDLDKTFREYLKTMSDESEKVIIASLTATFLEAYDAERIVITVDGKVLETNHKTYDEPFGYDREYINVPLQSK